MILAQATEVELWKGKKWHHEQLIYKKCQHARTSINIIPPDHKSTMQAQLYMCSSEYSLLSVLLSRTHEGKVNEGTRMRVCTPFNVCMQHSAIHIELKSRNGMDTLCAEANTKFVGRSQLDVCLACAKIEWGMGFILLRDGFCFYVNKVMLSNFIYFKGVFVISTLLPNFNVSHLDVCKC